MRILITNDDGIFAPGLGALQRAFARSHAVTVVAPDRERSAIGHGITLHQPLRAEPVALGNGCRGIAVSGTPADCIKIAVLEIMDPKPDMVISGINPGANLGININYSGTVAAAKEASLYGISALAVSVQAPASDHYDEMARYMVSLADQVAAAGLPFGTFLNVNFPDMPVAETAGVRVCRQGIEMFPENIEKRVDPRNRPYYWQGCDAQTFHDNPDSDGSAVAANYIAITPLKCDTTDYTLLDSLENLIG
jgi:5'-nucleotidase